jgi:hypothetical protein
LVTSSLHPRTETHPVSAMLCFLDFRTPNDGPSSEPQQFWVVYTITRILSSLCARNILALKISRDRIWHLCAANKKVLLIIRLWVPVTDQTFNNDNHLLRSGCRAPGRTAPACDARWPERPRAAQVHMKASRAEQSVEEKPLNFGIW